jgi:phenylacetate-coenzyme A ligase PaaK-like adenylate-forming protein
VLDKDTLEPVGSGEPGVLVFSHIDSRGTVLLRYYTGDYVFNGIVNDKCPECGHQVPRITNKIERLVDMEKGLTSTKVKGNLIDFNVFDQVLSQIKELRQYRVLITKKDPKDPYSLDEIIIEVGIYNKYAKKIEQIKKNIISKFKAYTDITPKIKLKPAQQIFDQVMNTMKGVRIIDKRK